MSSTDGHHQWRTHYAAELDGGWLSRLLRRPNGPKPQQPWPELKHPRRVPASGSLQTTDGSYAHFTGYSKATPAQEAWYRVHKPEYGLSAEDVKAYRKSQRVPVMRLIAAMVFWRK